MKTFDGYDGSGFTGNYTDIDVFDLTLDPLLNDCYMINVFWKRMLMNPTAQTAMNVIKNWWQ